jgi:hypothetical protein
MSKLVVKQECVRARVWGVRKAPGLVTTSLTTPVRVRTFLMRRAFLARSERPPIMVCATSPRLEYVPQVNLSRMFLFRAADALDAGRIFEAGCLLRESVRRQLFAECNWKGCLPAKKEKQRSPMALLYALNDAGHCGKCGFQWTKEIIDLVNKCAHCVPVDARTLRSSIEFWHTFIDGDPCGEPTDRPVKNCKSASEGYDVDDCGDDDDGDDWKIGGAI